MRVERLRRTDGELITGVYSVVGVAVGLCGVAVGLLLDTQPDQAHLEIVRALVLLPGEPAVGSGPLDDPGGARVADVVEPLVGEAAVEAELRIELVVDHRIDARAEYRPTDQAAEDRRTDWTHPERGAHVREAPDRRRVPQVRHRGAVVH